MRIKDGLMDSGKFHAPYSRIVYSLIRLLLLKKRGIPCRKTSTRINKNPAKSGIQSRKFWFIEQLSCEWINGFHRSVQEYNCLLLLVMVRLWTCCLYHHIE